MTHRNDFMSDRSEKFYGLSGIKKQKGLSLFELMVALSLGLFVMAGTLQVFVGSRQTLDVIQSNSSMQEAAQFGFYFINKMTRQAGYLNAGNLDTTTGSTSFANELVGKFNAAGTSEGAQANANPFITNPWEADATFAASSVVASDSAFAPTGATVKAGTDVLQIRLQGEDDGTMTDCEGQPIDSGTHQINFFVGDDDQLYCQVDARSAVGLVGVVEDMQLQFGVATNPSGDPETRYIINNYQNAADIADWSQVMTVRVALLAASDNSALDKTSKSYTVLDKAAQSFSDGKSRQVFTQTIALRGNLSI